MKKITEKLLVGQNGPIFPAITAHSGCEGTPDNSLEHIRAAIDSGAEMLEIDVRLKDGLLYLWHDVPENFSACVTLEECFRMVEPSALGVNCDLKEPGLVAPVIELAARCGMEDRIVFTGTVTRDDLPALNVSSADWFQGLWHSDHESDDLADACALYRELKNTYEIINIDKTMIDDHVLAVTATAGYPLSVWTVSTESELRRIMALGCAANITTRTPRLALEIRKELFGKKNA